MTFPPRPRKFAHTIAHVRYGSDPTPLECSCGWATKVYQDHAAQDRHEPVHLAWLAHRREVGAPMAWAGGRVKEDVA